MEIWRRNSEEEVEEDFTGWNNITKDAFRRGFQRRNSEEEVRGGNQKRTLQDEMRSQRMNSEGIQMVGSKSLNSDYELRGDIQIGTSEDEFREEFRGGID